MDYRAIYDRLIERSKGRVVEGYTERHHIRPRCLGGSNAKSNITRLTPEEHYIAHQLLACIYPKHLGLLGAAMLLGGGDGQRATNKIYGWMRRRFSKISSEALKGRTFSPEVRAKISAALTGTPLSSEHRKKLSDAKMGAVATPEVLARRAKRKAAYVPKPHRFRGPHSAEGRRNISLALTGRVYGPQSEAHIANAAAARTGKKRSEAVRAKMRERMLGVKPSEETRAKMRASRVAFISRISSSESAHP